MHGSIDFETDLDDEELAEGVFRNYLDETNARKNALNYEYLVTEEDGVICVNEIGEDDNGINARRASITEEGVIEDILTDEEAREVKNRYEEVKD